MNKLPSNKNFGIVFFIVFILITVYLLSNKNDLFLYSLLIAFFFLISGFLNAKILNPLNKIWYKFGLTLNKILSPIILGFIFFLVITPIAIIMRALNKDLLKLKFTEKKTYWIDKNETKSDMKNQF